MINYAYKPDTFLQACDVVRLVRRATESLQPGSELSKFIVFACEETGWDITEMIAAINDGEKI